MMTAIAPERPPWEEGSVWPTDWDPSKFPKIGTPVSDSFNYEGFSLNDILKQSTEMRKRFEKTIAEVESIMLPIREIAASGDPDDDDDDDDDVDEYRPEPVAGAIYDDVTGWTEPVSLSDVSQSLHEYDREVIAGMARVHIENEDTQPIMTSSWEETAETVLVPWVPDETRVLEAREAVSDLEMTRGHAARVYIRRCVQSVKRRFKAWSARSLDALKDYVKVLNGSQTWTRQDDDDDDDDDDHQGR